MKKSRKWITVFLIAAMLAQMTACGKTQETTDAPETRKEAESTETVVETEPETSAWEMLSKEDYAGYTFHILSFNKEILSRWFLADELTGNIFNDTVYERNRSVEELYNISIQPSFDANESTALKQLINDAASSGGEYDITYQWGMKMVNAVQAGALYNLMSVNTMDVTKPWWNRNAVETFTLVPGKLYYAANAINANSVDDAACLYFNSDLAAQYGLSDPYQMVYDGTWTIDAMYDMMCAVAANLDGSDERTVNDMYGTTAAWGQIMGIYTGCGLKLGETGADGTMKPTFANEKALAVADWLKKVIGDPTMTADMLSDAKWAYDAFYSGHSLFYMASIGAMTTLRDQMDPNFGILPNPKYDTAQAAYYTVSGGRNTPLLGMAVTQSDPERTGKIVEAMAIYSRDHLTDAYIDVTLVGKCSRNENTEAMLRTIMDSITYDIAFLTVPTFFDKWYPAISGGGDTLSSTAASIQESVAVDWTAYIETIKALP